MTMEMALILVGGVWLFGLSIAVAALAWRSLSSPTHTDMAQLRESQDELGQRLSRIEGQVDQAVAGVHLIQNYLMGAGPK